MNRSKSVQITQCNHLNLMSFYPFDYSFLAALVDSFLPSYFIIFTTLNNAW